jgi:regulatory protein
MNDKFTEGLSKAMKYCSKYEACISSVKQKLVAWNIDSDIHEAIIDQLIDEKFIDEERFTEIFIKDKILQKWGKTKIKHHLKHKQIPERIINIKIQEIDKQDYLNNLEYLFNKKNNSLKEEDPFKRKDKIIRHLVGKGYEFELVLEIID